MPPKDRAAEAARMKVYSDRKIAPCGLPRWQAREIATGRACDICGAAAPEPPLRVHHVDHDHATMKLRGVLCNNCNQGLGRFRDDPALLDRAAAYLRSYA